MGNIPGWSGEEIRNVKSEHDWKVSMVFSTNATCRKKTCEGVVFRDLCVLEWGTSAEERKE